MTKAPALTLKQLRALAGGARRDSMAAAARQMNLTVPAVHNQLKLLEEMLGVPLLERSADSAGSRLTPAGQVLLRSADRIDAILAQGLQQIDELRRGQSGRITLWVVSTAKSFAPVLVKMLKLLHPEVTIILEIGNRDAILKGIETGPLDLVILGRLTRSPVVDAMPLGLHPHGIDAPPDHPLAGRAALSWADLRAETFLTRERGSGTRIRMERYLDRLGDGEAHATVKMGTDETIKQAVMAWLGVAFQSPHTVVAELRHQRLTLHATANTPVERHWFLVHEAARPLEPVAQRLHATIPRLNGSFLPDLPAASRGPATPPP